MTLNDIWVTVFTLIKSITGDVNVKEKGTLQKQIDDCFTSASNGKKAIASAITGKGVSTAADADFATMAANIKNIKTSPNLQAKNAALSTSAQTIKADTGYDGLSQVAIPAVSGTAGVGDVLTGKTFASGTAGIGKTGTMPNKGAWTGATTGNGNVAIPAGYHNGSGYVSGAGAYNKGVTDADARANVNSTNYKTGYNKGVSDADGRTNADSANYKSGYNAGVSATKKGTAAAGDVLSGKTFTNASSVHANGSMANKGGTTVDAGAVTQDDDYTYFAVPASGYYNTASKVRALNSNIVDKAIKPSATEILSSSQAKVSSFPAEIGKYYLVLRGHLANTHTSSYLDVSVSSGGELVSKIKWKSGVNSSWEGKSVCAIVKATATTVTMSAAVNYVCITDF